MLQHDMTLPSADHNPNVHSNDYKSSFCLINTHILIEFEKKV